MTKKQFKKECLRRVKAITEELDRLTDNGKQQNLREYFEDALDVTYYISGNGEYRGVAVTITTGGPHIEVNTNGMAVKLWWGGEKAEWSIRRNTADAIDEMFKEYYQALR